MQALKAVGFTRWPDQSEEASLAIRDYWLSGDEVGVQNGMLFKGQSYYTKATAPRDAGTNPLGIHLMVKST